MANPLQQVAEVVQSLMGEAQAQPVVLGATMPKDFQNALRKATQFAQNNMWEWAFCRQFLAGNQYLQRSTGTLVTLPPQQGRSQVVANKIMPIYRAKQSQLDVMYPDMLIAPETPSYEDVQKAIANEHAARHMAVKTDAVEKFLEMLDIALCDGPGYLHLFVDPGTGVLSVRPFSGFDYRLESGAVKREEASWEAVRSFVKKEKVRVMYPETTKDLPTLSQQGQFDRSRVNPGSPDKVPVDSVELWDVYTKDGAHGVWCDSRWLWEGRSLIEIPPIIDFGYEPRKDSIYPQGAVQPLIDLQRARNSILCMLIDNIRVSSNMIWFLPTASGINKAMLTDVAGQIIPFNAAGGKPVRESGAPVPQHFFESLKLLDADMQDVAGVHPSSLGKRTPGAGSGVAIQQLKGADEAQMTAVQRRANKAFTMMVKMLLKFAKALWSEGECVRAFGPYGQVMYSTMQATDIMDDPDIRIEVNTLFASNVAAREEQLQKWVQMGALTAADAMERSTLRDFDKKRMDAMADYAFARKILDAVIAGKNVQIYTTSPVTALKNVFDEHMKSDAYYQPWLDACMAGDAIAAQAHELNMTRIRDVYLSIVAPANLPGPTIDLVAAQTLYPRGPGMPVQPQAATGPGQPPAPPSESDQPPGNPTPQTGEMDPAMAEHRVEMRDSGVDQQPHMGGGTGVF